MQNILIKKTEVELREEFQNAIEVLQILHFRNHYFQVF